MCAPGLWVDAGLRVVRLVSSLQVLCGDGMSASTIAIHDEERWVWLMGTRQLHYIAPQLAYTVHPASSVRAANTGSFPVCATTRKALSANIVDTPATLGISGGRWR